MSNLVSIIIPCRNEGGFLEKCLDSVVHQDYSNFELLIVDGMSSDNTRSIINKYKAPFIRVIDNPDIFTPYALNKGIKESKGDIILIMGAHSFYKNDYISKSVDYMEKYDADNVGGVIKSIPSRDTIIANAIAICLSDYFGVFSDFRREIKKPKEVDTVFGGCYRRDIFKKIGMFNEHLHRSQDMEYNLRLKNAGGKILLVPDIVSYYYASSTLKKFFIHNIQDGIWAVLPIKYTKRLMKLRHYIPLIFILTFPLSIWPYLIVSFFWSFRSMLQKKDVRYFFAMPVVYGARHVGYGLGSLIGMLKLFF